MASSRTALILFARDPEPGKVKTRLSQEWDEDRVCELYRCFLEDTLNTLRRVDADQRFIGVHPTSASGYFDEAENRGFLLFEQEGGDLGERMKRAFAARFADGFSRVVIIGADSPSLPEDYIAWAMGSDRDLMLGPSTDGGYYLIGMNREVRDVFADVPWGSAGVLQATRQHIARLGLSVEVLPPWYDVDVPDDVRFLNEHLSLMEISGLAGADATRGFLTQFLES